MADKIISATLQVNTGTSAQDIGNVNKQLDQTSKELSDASKGGKEATSSFTNLKDGLSKLPGPLGAVKGGIDTVQSSLKVLAANPIVLVVTLLVAALVGLYKMFASTEAGAEKLEQIFSGLGAIVTVIRDRILALAGAVISFFKGDFAEAIEQTKAAVSGVGDAIVKAYSEAADATRELQEAQDELNRDLTVSRAKLNRDLAQTKELISDDNATYAERKEAIKEVSAAEEAQTAAELANAEKTLHALERKMALDAEDADLKDEYAKQQAKVYEIQEKQAQNQRTFNKQNRALDKEEQDKADAAAKASHDAKVKQLAEEAKLLEEARKKEIEHNKIIGDYFIEGVKFRQKQRDDAAKTQKEQDDTDLKAREDYLEDTTNAEYKAVMAQVKIKNDQVKTEKELNEKRKQNEENYLAASASAAGALSDLLGRQTVAGKALAVAQAIISTYLAAAKTLAAFSEVPIPGYAFIQVGATIAAGLAQVKSILSVKVPGSSAGGSVPAPQSLGATAAPIAPTQQGTQIDQDSIRGIGNAVSNRVYVLEQDISHDQDRASRLNRAARLGN
jgi:chemotaxis protein histidine kinase CheA